MGLRAAAALRRTLAVLVLLASGCGGPVRPDADPVSPGVSRTSSAPSSSPTVSGPTVSTSAARPEPTASPSPRETPSYSTWPLGVRVLPERPDGFGVVRPTPPSLRERRYPSRDVLPPPPDGAWRSRIGPVTDAIAARLAWQQGCPVALADLRYLTVSFRGFDGAAHTGELVVAASQAEPVVSVFRALFADDFPIEEMRLTSLDELDLPPTGDGNNTGAYVCRPTTGRSSGFSQHAYGLAIDVDPFMNPYEKGDVVLPERASSYLDRADVRPGMVVPGGLVVREFARIGWEWGGDYQSLKDYQHFSETGL